MEWKSRGDGASSNQALVGHCIIGKVSLHAETGRVTGADCLPLKVDHARRKLPFASGCIGSILFRRSSAKTGLSRPPDLVAKPAAYPVLTRYIISIILEI